MPRLWSETIDTHRRAVHEAILDTAAALVRDSGAASVTMSAIAEGAGIGRATLYKYFPDVDAVLAAWHERQVGRHLDQLVAVRDRKGNGIEGLRAVLEAVAMLSHSGRGGGTTAAHLHDAAHMTHARQRLSGFLQELLAECAAAGDVRVDVPTAELAAYCSAALTAATAIRSRAGVRRLVDVTLAGLRP